MTKILSDFKNKCHTPKLYNSEFAFKSNAEKMLLGQTYLLAFLRNMVHQIKNFDCINASNFLWPKGSLILNFVFVFDVLMYLRVSKRGISVFTF